MNYKTIMRTLGILLLTVLSTQGVDAARLTPQQALSRVQSSSVRLRMPGLGSYELTYTGNAAGTPALYVFNKGTNGFIIASADDRMPALLGYSNNGAFDIKTASPELKWWLSQYTDEADYFFKNESKFASRSSSVKQRASRANIEPLVKTKWDQSVPYNNDCPLINGEKSVTGCVATAMAQVINYHKYPVSGTGSNSYECNGATYSFDYGSTTFDWANMLDTYDDNATEPQKAAVAKLMYACGVGVNMQYGVMASGAQDPYIPYALNKFFNYDKGVRLLDK